MCACVYVCAPTHAHVHARAPTCTHERAYALKAIFRRDLPSSAARLGERLDELRTEEGKSHK